MSAILGILTNQGKSLGFMSKPGRIAVVVPKDDHKACAVLNNPPKGYTTIYSRQGGRLRARSLEVFEVAFAIFDLQS